MSTVEFSAATMLPEEFVPGPNSVIIGRGKKIAAHAGNQRFQEIIRVELAAYSAASSKSLKSSILSKVVDQVRRGCPQTAFVKQDPETGRWHSVEDFAARITTAQAFRDSLHQNYRSSKKFKQQKRKVGLSKALSIQDLGIVAKKSKPSRVSQSDGALFRLRNKSMQPQEPGRNATWGQQEATVDELDENIFSLLYERFSTNVDNRSDDPFEPTPLQEGKVASKSVATNPFAPQIASKRTTNMFASFFAIPEAMEVVPETAPLESKVAAGITKISSCESNKNVDSGRSDSSRPLIQPNQSSSFIPGAVSA